MRIKMNGTGVAMMLGLLLFCAIPIYNTLAQDTATRTRSHGRGRG